MSSLSNISRPNPETVQKRQEFTLSGRERELLVLAARGLTDQGISTTLGISVGTVATYWGRVRIKFGPMSRTELVAIYLNEQSKDAIEKLTSRVAELLVQIQDHIKSEELFRGLLNTAPDAIVVVSSNGTIQLANKRAELMFGYEDGELVGLSVEQLVPARHHQSHALSRKEYDMDSVQRNVGEHLTTFAMRRDRSEFPMTMALTSSQTTEGILVTCIIRDLTIHLEGQGHVSKLSA